MRRKNSGFTLVELLVVIGIIALLISILLPTLSKARQQATIVACSAQLRDFFNAIQMYTVDNKDHFPGPCLAQIRAGYKTGSNQITEFIYPYLKLPPPTATYQKFKVLRCPGYTSNPGFVPDEQVWTYTMNNWDPYPWFGYAGIGAFPIHDARIPPETSGPLQGYTRPMKMSQVWKGSEMPLIADCDSAQNVYEQGVAVSPSLGMAGAPNHGGKAETTQGIQYASGTVGQPFINWKGSKSAGLAASTNAARNWLFMDGHVLTRRVSGTILPPDFVTRYGPIPTGWSLPYYPQVN